MFVKAILARRNTISRVGQETSFLEIVNGMQRFLRPNYMSNEKNPDFCEKMNV